MSMNVAEAQRMLSASREHPALVAQVVPSPFGLKGNAVMRELIADGYLGELREVHVVGLNAALADPAAMRYGLSLLDWLLDVETGDTGHLSVTAVGGWGPGEQRARFDQQPIEVAALADACARAWALTGEQRWSDGLQRAIGWFRGDNDSGARLYDPVSGGGFDALTPAGRNTNQGAESTLAMVATLQYGQVH